jgi:integrase
VLLRGTKRKTRFRTVPIVSPVQRSLIEYAMRYAAGQGPVLFQPWANVRRDLAGACERAGIERASPNDLRRTFANWYVAAGVPLFPIAQAMGHKDTRMLERVYGRQSPDQLAVAFSRALGLAPDCSAGATEPAENDEPAGPGGPAGLVISRGLVPGAGIEPATRGFSVPCSTD